ncbi:hypothetical protein OG21DRAFT_1499333 [Imleria badia]|nr:hypothetical protein OG21DRAFT_1499333 [Imleria badia]
MTNRGRVVDRGRGRATATAGGSPGGWGSESPNPNRERGGTPPSFRGDAGDRGGGRGFFIRGGPLSPRGRGHASIFMHGQRAEIDPRIADNSDKEVVASFNPTRALRDPDNQPLRPDFGTDGKEIKLRTNFFPVQFHQQTPSLKLYTYHVNINPAPGYRAVNRRVYELAERSSEWGQAGMIGRVVHDNNANLLSASLLPQPLIIRVPYYNEDESGPPRQGDKMFTLTIIFVQELDTGPIASYLAGQMQYRDYNPSPIVSALNLILKSLPQKLDIFVWRNPGVEAWKGIYTSARPTYKQLMVNVDVCSALFYTPGNLVHAMNAFCDATFGPRTRIDSFFRGVRIEVTHFGYRKIVRKLVSFTARTYSFDTPEYGHVTLEDYFRRKYNIRLQYPDLQLVDVDGKAEKYLPAELCDILPGQLCRRGPTIGKQPFVAMSAAASRPPNIHGETTVKQLRHQLGLDVIRPELESFGITIGPDMAVIPGRILSKPGITYASSTAVSISDRASWNLVGVKFAAGARLDNWTVLVIKDGISGAEFASASDGDLYEVMSAFRHMCNTSGMSVTADPTYATAQLPCKAADPSDCMRRAATQTIKDTLLNIKPKPAFILVMLANEDKATYEGIKYLCDVHLDVATVCVQSSKIRRSAEALPEEEQRKAPRAYPHLSQQCLRDPIQHCQTSGTTADHGGIPGIQPQRVVQAQGRHCHL